MNIAIIPARGGSKRIPRKNIKEFNEKPMIAIAHAILAAKLSRIFDHIIVRPGNGLHPRYYEQFIGRRVTGDVKKGEPVIWDMI
jgi:sialic acid synthase SpsE